MAERLAEGQKESLWNSRLFKGGLVLAVIGAATGIVEIAAVGVIALGAGWAINKGKK